jgi:hypothetical protein
MPITCVGTVQSGSATATPDDGAGLGPATDVFAVAVLVAKARLAAAEARSGPAPG